MKQYPTHPDGALDAGAVREPPCAKRTWCLLPEAHTGNCVELPRVGYERRNRKER